MSLFGWVVSGIGYLVIAGITNYLFEDWFDLAQDGCILMAIFWPIVLVIGVPFFIGRWICEHIKSMVEGE